MFCNEDHSKLVPESTQPGGFPSWTIVDNLHEKPKIEHLTLEQKVNNFKGQYLLERWSKLVGFTDITGRH